MEQLNMLEAKSSLPRLVETVEMGKQSEIIIARNGLPAARLVPIEPPGSTGVRIGVARGLFVAPGAFDETDEEIATLFTGTAD